MIFVKNNIGIGDSVHVTPGEFDLFDKEFNGIVVDIEDVDPAAGLGPDYVVQDSDKKLYNVLGNFLKKADFPTCIPLL